MPTGEQLAASLVEARTRLSEVRDRARAALEVDGGARLLMDNSGMRFNRLFAVWGDFLSFQYKLSRSFEQTIHTVYPFQPAESLRQT